MTITIEEVDNGWIVLTEGSSYLGTIKRIHPTFQKAYADVERLFKKHIKEQEKYF